MLEKRGFTVLTAENGREGVEVFRKNQSNIDCVILDLTMPHMDGDEAFDIICGLREDVRVITEVASFFFAQDCYMPDL